MDDGEVASREVSLAVPARTDAPRHGEQTHDAVLLVAAADEESREGDGRPGRANHLVVLRGPGTIVSDLAAGGLPGVPPGPCPAPAAGGRRLWPARARPRPRPTSRPSSSSRRPSRRLTTRGRRRPHLRSKLLPGLRLAAGPGSSRRPPSGPRPDQVAAGGFRRRPPLAKELFQLGDERVPRTARASSSRRARSTSPAAGR